MVVMYYKSKLLETLIKEQLKKVLEQVATPEAPEDEIFGQYLFGPARTDTPDEPNTPAENRFLDALEAHIADNLPMGLEGFMVDILNLVNQGLYKPLLAPPQQEVYRILRLQKSDAMRLLKLSEKDLTEKPNRGWWVDGPLTLNPRNRNVMSWTTDPSANELKFFTKQEDGVVNVLLVADPNEDKNEFILNPKNFISKIQEPEKLPALRSIMRYLQREYETISFGSVKCVGAAFYYVDYEDIRSKSENLKITKNLTENLVKYVDQMIGDRLQELYDWWRSDGTHIYVLEDEVFDLLLHSKPVMNEIQKRLEEQVDNLPQLPPSALKNLFHYLVLVVMKNRGMDNHVVSDLGPYYVTTDLDNPVLKLQKLLKVGDDPSSAASQAKGPDKIHPELLRAAKYKKEPNE